MLETQMIDREPQGGVIARLRDLIDGNQHLDNPSERAIALLSEEERANLSSGLKAKDPTVLELFPAGSPKRMRTYTRYASEVLVASGQHAAGLALLKKVQKDTADSQELFMVRENVIALFDSAAIVQNYNHNFPLARHLYNAVIEKLPTLRAIHGFSADYFEYLTQINLMLIEARLGNKESVAKACDQILHKLSNREFITDPRLFIETLLSLAEAYKLIGDDEILDGIVNGILKPIESMQPNPQPEKPEAQNPAIDADTQSVDQNQEMPEDQRKILNLFRLISEDQQKKLLEQLGELRGMLAARRGEIAEAEDFLQKIESGDSEEKDEIMVSLLLEIVDAKIKKMEQLAPATDLRQETRADVAGQVPAVPLPQVGASVGVVADIDRAKGYAKHKNLRFHNAEIALRSIKLNLISCGELSDEAREDLRVKLCENVDIIERYFGLYIIEDINFNTGECHQPAFSLILDLIQKLYPQRGLKASYILFLEDLRRRFFGTANRKQFLLDFPDDVFSKPKLMFEQIKKNPDFQIDQMLVFDSEGNFLFDSSKKISDKEATIDLESCFGLQAELLYFASCAGWTENEYKQVLEKIKNQGLIIELKHFNLNERSLAVDPESIIESMLVAFDGVGRLCLMMRDKAAWLPLSVLQQLSLKFDFLRSKNLSNTYRTIYCERGLQEWHKLFYETNMTFLVDTGDDSPSAGDIIAIVNEAPIMFGGQLFYESFPMALSCIAPLRDFRKSRVELYAPPEEDIYDKVGFDRVEGAMIGATSVHPAFRQNVVDLLLQITEEQCAYGKRNGLKFSLSLVNRNMRLALRKASIPFKTIAGPFKELTDEMADRAEIPEEQRPERKKFFADGQPVIIAIYLDAVQEFLKQGKFKPKAP